MRPLLCKLGWHRWQLAEVWGAAKILFACRCGAVKAVEQRRRRP